MTGFWGTKLNHTTLTVERFGPTPDLGNLTTYTWSGHSIGTAAPERLVVVGIMGRAGTAGTVTTCTIGGITATLVGNVSTQQPAPIAFANVPTGTTADIVVTFSTGQSRAQIRVWAITGTGTTIGKRSDANSQNNTGMSLSDVSVGDLVVYHGALGAVGTGAWSGTGVTEEWDTQLESAATHSGGSHTAATSGGLSITPGWSVVTNTPQNTAAAFGFLVSGPETRNDYLWPFADTSVWVLGRSTQATFESSTSPKTATWLTGTVAGQVNRSTFSIQPALATTSDPLAEIRDPGTNALRATIYVPSAFTPPGGTDKNSVIVQPDGTVYDCYKFTKVNDNLWTSTSVESYSLRGSGIERGIRSADVALLGGLIRKWEADGAMNGTLEEWGHSIAGSIPQSMLGGTSPYWVWPADQIDNQSVNPYEKKDQAGGIELGTYFSIPSSTNLEIISFGSNIGRVLARTIQRRGYYVVDRSDFKTVYMEPTCTSASETAMKADWQNIIIGLMRRCASNSSSSPNGGAMGTTRLGDPIPAFA